MSVSKTLSLLVVLAAVLVAGIVVIQPLAVEATTGSLDKKNKSSFNQGSLYGSYGTAGRANGFQSRSVGVADFDGRGGVTRTVRINANDGDGGRRLIDLTSVGTYSVNSDGTGEIYFLNMNSSGDTTAVTYDFVIRTTESGGGKSKLLASSLEAIQREPGVTASLVEESLTRRNGVR
ncbi:MAG: hypothetical protein GY818_19770 [Planctomycetaceae bacterium]|nr:hypothetical protein [Planctomycetaceae bacterium]